MNRKTFIKTCGMACLGATTFSTLLTGCTGSKMATGTINGEDMIVPLSEFVLTKDGVNSFRNYVIIQNEFLKYPICIYRTSDTEYTALWMRCTHQGTELTAFGDKMTCSAHGSEFDTQGSVINGPADESLRQFPVTVLDQQLKISLKKV